VAGVFRGYYTVGFESSKFVPCAADAWFIAGDALRREPYDERRAWVEWPNDSGRTLRRVTWPRIASLRRTGYATYFVQWRGTVEGPGRYRHLGVSAFEIRVDSVLVVRKPTRRDCRPVTATP
jgi:hypothetical protein